MAGFDETDMDEELARSFLPAPQGRCLPARPDYPTWQGGSELDFMDFLALQRRKDNTKEIPDASGRRIRISAHTMDKWERERQNPREVLRQEGGVAVPLEHHPGLREARRERGQRSNTSGTAVWGRERSSSQRRQWRPVAPTAEERTRTPKGKTSKGKSRERAEAKARGGGKSRPRSRDQWQSGTWADHEGWTEGWQEGASSSSQGWWSGRGNERHGWDSKGRGRQDARSSDRWSAPGAWWQSRNQ